MTACRGIRGATTADANTEEAIHEATTELVQELIDANGLEEDSLAAVFFTITPDLDAAFPATAARSYAGACSISSRKPRRRSSVISPSNENSPIGNLKSAIYRVSL